jgi:hypothetical protein
MRAVTMSLKLQAEKTGTIGRFFRDKTMVPAGKTIQKMICFYST